MAVIPSLYGVRFLRKMQETDTRFRMCPVL